MKTTTLRAAARGLALFLGLFFALNFIIPTLDTTEWLLSFIGFPIIAQNIVVAGATLALLSFALLPSANRARANLSATLIGLALLISLLNCVEFYFLLFHGQIATTLPLPLSVFTAVALSGILWVLRNPSLPTKRENIFTALNFGTLVILFPLAQMIFFGETDYRRKADAIVVFGARAYKDGRPSDALADRVRTACDLYKTGLASVIVMSGGPGDGAIHETEAMRNYAVRRGVPESAMILDQEGLNTDATLRNLQSLAAAHHFKKILAVSQPYHLPRVKLSAQKRGLAVYTVPAHGPLLLAKLPYFMARETAAWWVYFFKS